jgi:hypothetical protein
MTERVAIFQIARKRITIAVLLLLLPFIVIGASRVKNDTTDMQQWLPEGQAERDRYEKFVETFGPDDTLIVSWPGCTLEDSRLSELHDAYERYTPAAEGDEFPGYFRQVSSGATVLESMQAKPFEMEERAARARLALSLSCRHWFLCW